MRERERASLTRVSFVDSIDLVDRLYRWKAPIDHALGLRPNAPTDSFFHTNRHSLVHSAH
jgi:hypothetical protein